MARATGTASTTRQPRVPSCASLVGARTAAVVVDGTPICLTGRSVASDRTVAGTVHCADVTTGAKVTVYFWLSHRPDAPDQHEYAGRSDGVVKVVPGAGPRAVAIVAKLDEVGHCA